MTYRDDLAALEARKAALDVEHASISRQRDDAARLVEEARARTRLPVLPNLRIASPCHESWEGMTGDDRVRHCGACDKDVFNLSALTLEQAESLIREKAGKLCGRYYQRKDGTILLADCEIGARRVRRGRNVAIGVAVTLVAGIAAAAIIGHEAPPRHTMGSIGVDPTANETLGKFDGTSPHSASGELK